MADISLQDVSQLIPVTGQQSTSPPISFQDLSPFLSPSQQAQAQTGQQPAQTVTGAQGQPNNDQVASNLNDHLGGVLSGHGQTFVDAGKKYAVDPNLLAGISIFETGNGTSSMAKGKNNIAGLYDSKAKEYRSFSSVADSIEFHARNLRTNYLDQGLNTIEDIAKQYAPPGAANDPNDTNAQWPGSVSRIVSALGGPKTAGTPIFGPDTNQDVQKLPSSFGMRVATPNDVQKFNAYLQGGGDINQVPVYDRLAVAIAQNPNFLSDPKNFETFYGLVWKPLQQQSAGEQFNQAVNNLPKAIGDVINGVGQSIVNTAQGSMDAAQLAFRKATGQTTDTNYQDIQKRFAREQATMSQGLGHAVSDTWDFITNIYNGTIQLTHPLFDLATTDPKSREELDRQYAQAAQQTAASQQGLAQLGNTLQDFSGAAYQLVGAYADVGKKIQQATPNEAAVQGYATVLNPLNYIGVGEGAAAVDALKPVFFEKGLQAAEDVAGAAAKKGVLDTTQILPKEPELSAANPGYAQVRNVQSQFAPAARNAAQDLEDKSAILSQHLTTMGKIAGDPDTATGIAAGMMQGGGQLLQSAGDLAKKVSDFPEMIANRFAGGNPVAKKIITDVMDKIIFAGLLEHLGPVGAMATAAIEHLPEISDAFSNLFKVAGKELSYGQATIPYGTRVAQQTKLMPKFLASFLDSPLVQTATAVTKGGAAGAAAGAAAGGLAGGIPGAVSGAAFGGLQGMAGGGFGQWMKFQNPNQYFIQARGDWKRYRDMLSPADRTSFGQLHPTNQLMLAQTAQHFPALQVDYIHDPNGPRGMHYVDEVGRSHIQVNTANPDSAIRGILAHELTHGTVYGGMLPDVYDTLLGNPQRQVKGQYTAVDANDNPIGIDPATNRYTTDQDFANLKNQYTNALAQSGKPTAHLTDLDIAREIYAEHGVDYLLSGGAITDANSAFRPGLLSKNALKTALAKMGYTFDDQGRMVGAPNGQIGGTGLFSDLQKNPALHELAQSYFRTTWREGKINSEEVPTTRFTKLDMRNPNVADTWLTNSSEIMRTPDGKVVRDKNTGLPIYRTPKEVEEYNANFAQSLRKGIDALSEDQRMAIGYRQEGDNVFIRYLPDSVVDSLAKTNQYNPHQIAALRLLSKTLGDAGSPGMEMRFFYHKALTQNKRYGQFEGTEKIAVPYGIEITKDKNINIKSVDFNQLTNNYLRMRNRPPFKDLWASPDEFTQDAHTYFTNHSEGRPGADAIGVQKRDAINALSNFGVQLQRDSNPLVGRLPQSLAPIIKSYRIDRSNQITATGSVRPFISEDQYYKMKANYLPGRLGEEEFRSVYAGGAEDNRATGVEQRPGTYPAGNQPQSQAGAAPWGTEVSYLPRSDPTAIPVTMTTTKAGKPIVQTHDYGITSAPLVADKQPPTGISRSSDHPNDYGHIDFLTAPDQKRLTHLDNQSAVTAYADKLVNEFGQWTGNKDVMKAKNWYQQVRGLLLKATGNSADAELFAHLIAATSPQQGVVQNWHDAKTAFERFKAGHYDDAITEFKRTGKITEDMKPRKENGALFGANSDAVLKVLAGTWLDSVEGPKTPNFFDNLFGRGKEATIDKWAARTMRRMGYEDVPGAPAQYRLQPKSEKGVSDLDFAFSQQAFRQAADRLKMDPHQLQAIMWYAEKHEWAQKGYAKGGAAAAKASYVPMLREYATQKAAERAGVQPSLVSSGGSS